MNPDEFNLAKQLENEGWEYRGRLDAGYLLFFRIHHGVPFYAQVSEDDK